MQKFRCWFGFTQCFQPQLNNPPTLHCIGCGHFEKVLRPIPPEKNCDEPTALGNMHREDLKQTTQQEKRIESERDRDADNAVFNGDKDRPAERCEHRFPGWLIGSSITSTQIRNRCQLYDQDDHDDDDDDRYAARPSAATSNHRLGLSGCKLSRLVG